MTEEDVTAYFQAIKSVFPDITLQSIELELENGKMAYFKFTKDEVQDNDFDVMPAGDYVGQISNHEWKPTKSGGHMLALTLELVAPEKYVGRKVWENLNIDNSNETAQKIAMAAMKQVCVACSAEGYWDAMFEADSIESLATLFEQLPEALYEKDIKLNIGIEKGKDGYPDKNMVKSYKLAAPICAPPVTASGKAKPSWK
jgi:hypothetical protein